MLYVPRYIGICALRRREDEPGQEYPTTLRMVVAERSRSALTTQYGGEFGSTRVNS